MRYLPNRQVRYTHVPKPRPGIIKLLIELDLLHMQGSRNAFTPQDCAARAQARVDFRNKLSLNWPELKGLIWSLIRIDPNLAQENPP